MNERVRTDLPPMPPRIAALKRDKRGYPVPWFVAWIDGAPDFRVIDTPKIKKAIEDVRCWICGGVMGAHKAFVIGPMCAINRVSAEPPSHVGCAQFAATACPFLVHPQAKRRDANLPEEAGEGPGVMLRRNPGVTLLWHVKRYHFNARTRLFDVGAPERVEWYCEGREATRAEVIESIDSGLPALRAVDDDPEAEVEIQRRYAQIQPLLPPAFNVEAVL